MAMPGCGYAWVWLCLGVAMPGCDYAWVWLCLGVTMPRCVLYVFPGMELRSVLSYIGTPSQSSFQENLCVHGISEKPLVFQFSNPADLDVFGAVQVEDGPVVLPPFLTLNNLLQPE